MYFVCKLQQYIQIDFEKYHDEMALAGVAQWIECWLVKWKAAGSVPSQGTFPSWGCVRGNQSMYLSHISASLPLFLPPFPSF